MGTMASQIISLAIVYSTVYSGADQSNHQSSASLAFVWGIHRWPVNSPHKWPVTRKIVPFDDVIMYATHLTDDHIRGTSGMLGWNSQANVSKAMSLSSISEFNRFSAIWRKYQFSGAILNRIFFQNEWKLIYALPYQINNIRMKVWWEWQQNNSFYWD